MRGQGINQVVVEAVDSAVSRIPIAPVPFWLPWWPMGVAIEWHGVAGPTGDRLSVSNWRTDLDDVEVIAAAFAGTVREFAAFVFGPDRCDPLPSAHEHAGPRGAPLRGRARVARAPTPSCPTSGAAPSHACRADVQRETLTFGLGRHIVCLLKDNPHLCVLWPATHTETMSLRRCGRVSALRPTAR